MGFLDVPIYLVISRKLEVVKKQFNHNSNSYPISFPDGFTPLTEPHFHNIVIETCQRQGGAQEDPYHADVGPCNFCHPEEITALRTLEKAITDVQPVAANFNDGMFACITFFDPTNFDLSDAEFIQTDYTGKIQTHWLFTIMNKTKFRCSKKQQIFIDHFVKLAEKTYNILPGLRKRKLTC